MDIKAKLETIFRDVFDDPSIKLHEQMTAKDIEDWDSLAHVQLIVATEKAFSIKFKMSDIMSLQNVGDFIVLIQKTLPSA